MCQTCVSQNTVRACCKTPPPPTAGYSVAAVCAGVLQYDVQLWNMLDIHSLCFFNHSARSEKPPFESEGKQCDFRLGSILRFSPRPLRSPWTLSSWKQRGHSQRLFIGATLMCGLTADISNIKLWATSELCREPPVSCLVIPPLTLMEMLRGSLYCGWKQARTEQSVYMFIKQFRAIWCLYCHACCYTVGDDYLCHYLPTGTDKPITAGDCCMRGVHFTLAALIDIYKQYLNNL